MRNTLSNGQRRIFFASLLLGNFAAMLAIAGSSIFVSAAMTAMGGLGLLGLAFTVESLFRCVVIPLSAKLGERYLRRTLYLIGLFLFSAGAVLCAVAWSPTIILVSRAVMGLAWGLFFSNLVAMLSDVYPPDQAPKMNGYMQTLGFVAALIAAPMAGIFVDNLSWQWALYVTIPISVLAFILMLICPNVQEKVNDGKKLDVAGSIALVVMLVPFSLALSWGGSMYAWTSPVILGMFAVCIIGIVLLVVAERKADDPILPGRLFKNRNLMLIFFIAVCFSAICSAGLFLPTIMQQGLGFTATESSIPTVCCSILCIVATSIVGTVFAKTQKAKGLIIVESVVALAVGAALWTVGSGTSLVFLCVVYGILGISQAIHQVVPYSYPAVAMKPQEIAVTIAFVSFGQILASTVFNSILGALMNVDLLLPLRSIAVFAAVMLVCAFIFKDQKQS